MLSARLAVAADLPAVQAITRAAYAEYESILDRPPLPVTEDYEPRIARGEVWLVTRDGLNVGLAALEPAADHLLIFSLAVLPGARGGVGRFLLDFAESRAKALSLPEVRLYTNGLMLRNISIYQKAGYVETGRAENPKRPGWVAVYMAKPV
jgi:ribosomal protein S18 acetylase RimI-like enzyme